jgi:hypothetical protein
MQRWFVPNSCDFCVDKYAVMLPFRITTASLCNADCLNCRISRPGSAKNDLSMTITTVLTTATDSQPLDTV